MTSRRRDRGGRPRFGPAGLDPEIVLANMARHRVRQRRRGTLAAGFGGVALIAGGFVLVAVRAGDESPAPPAASATAPSSVALRPTSTMPSTTSSPTAVSTSPVTTSPVSTSPVTTSPVTTGVVPVPSTPTTVPPTQEPTSTITPAPPTTRRGATQPGATASPAASATTAAPVEPPTAAPTTAAPQTTAGPATTSTSCAGVAVSARWSNGARITFTDVPADAALSGVGTDRAAARFTATVDGSPVRCTVTASYAGGDLSITALEHA